MAIVQDFIVSDISSYANFAQLKAIGAAFATFGWSKTADTGQAVWLPNVIAITGCTKSGTTVTYTYTLTSGPGLGIGNFLTITGMTNTANDLVSININALGSGTFTVTNSTGVTESGSSGAGVTAIPPTGIGLIEIWRPNDALQTGASQYFVLVHYGLFNPTSFYLTVQIGTGTNGTGALTGILTSSTQLTFNGGFGVQTFECDFSGDTSRMAALLFRTNQFTIGSFFSIERTKNASGADTATGVVLSASISASYSQVLVFGTAVFTRNAVPNLINSSATLNFNNVVGVSGGYPYYNGAFGNPLVNLLFASPSDLAEGALFPITIYGSSHTYLATKVVNIGGPNGPFHLIRYD